MNNTLLRSYCRYCKILFCKHDFEYNMILKKFVILKIPRVTGSDHVNNTCPLGYKGQSSREQYIMLGYKGHTLA